MTIEAATSDSTATERLCPGCGRLLSAGEFAVDRSRKSGPKSRCKRCDGERAAAYYHAHREAVLERLRTKREAALRARLAEQGVSWLRRRERLYRPRST